MPVKANRGHVPVQEKFTVTIGAWPPLGPRPPGMPAAAINLADQGAVTELEIISAVFAEAWMDAYAVETIHTPFAPSGITLDFGTAADPVRFTAAVVPGAIEGDLQYPPAPLVTQLQITVHATAGTLADLTAGRAVVSMHASRWTPTIERISP